ncbi:hypothetical protein V1260_15345 [Brachybacterium sp. J144]|uniref:hypothetical protein n=1 Tax=Brachybacterium sp. J144 TaxID=3116487 RepID=UPI002E79DDD0|nr:hypothetical protein [Brachybacterium sp. J144]MEE1652156.1 hypothetical protein [Brachybacterium sp. J144]
MNANDPDYAHIQDAEETLACRELWREEALLARLDPDQIGDELPADVPAGSEGEWREFVALYDMLEAGGELPAARAAESDRSAGCP